MLFIKSIIIGISIAIPIGPIAILCIRRTMANGLKSGIASGIGAATADAFYGVIASFGLTAISGFLIEKQLWLNLIGGLFLFYLGFKIFKSEPIDENQNVGNSSLYNDYLSTVFLTIINPATFLVLFSIFVATGFIKENINYYDATISSIGIFIGSMIWWLCLSFGVGLTRNKLNKKSMILLNKISALIIFSFSFIAMAKVYLSVVK